MLPADPARRTFELRPIGVVRSPFREKAEAPRQAVAGRGVEGTIELFTGLGLENATCDLASWTHIWVIFVFDRAEGWRPKVLPPRSSKRRGVLATRSPHRPNPIGMSAVALVSVEGLVLRVRDLDILDGTPVLDVKPYVAYADAVPGAGDGWLGEESGADPLPAWEVSWGDAAAAQRDWLEARGVPLRASVEKVLALGATPHAYRRIRRDGDGFRLAWKEWRVAFAAEGSRIRVTSVSSGFRPRELAGPDAPALHVAFCEAFRAAR